MSRPAPPRRRSIAASPARRAFIAAAALVLGTWLSGSASAQGDCTGVAPVFNTTLTAIPVVTGLTGRPHLVTAPPGDPDRIFIVEQNGLIRLKKRGDPPGQVGTFLDISGRVQAAAFLNEMGLLGLVFDPDYAATGELYVFYTAGTVSPPWNLVLARYTRSDTDPDAADPDSEEILLRIAKNQSNHNGGQVFFGPDGFLYMATGDGGGAGDQHGLCGNGQNTSVLLGKLLRLDVRGIDPAGLPPDCGGVTAGYAVPADNPFVGALGACDEIWAYGLRNPWRSAFDPASGDLYVADVGQNCWEEVNYRAAGTGAGANYGWRQMEGNHCFSSSPGATCDPPGVVCLGSPPCNDPSLVDPIFEYSHAGGCSITGGPVYRGCLMPNYSGYYFYGDYCSGVLGAFRVVSGAVTSPLNLTSQLDPSRGLISSLTGFGTDALGEMYIADRDGTILKIAPPFADLEVSGAGSASPLQLGPAGWSWEDVAFNTMHPVGFYRVYRGAPGGVFRCIVTTPQPQWIPGDPDLPPAGSLFAYVVTAVSPGGSETRPGITAQSFLLDGCS